MTVGWIKCILLMIVVKQSICDEEYMIGFNEGLSDCNNFENDKFRGNSLELGKCDVEGEDAMYLEGFIEIKSPISSGYMFDLEIAKETELGSEPMWSCSMDVCKSLDDEDAPWSSAMKSLGISGCPIETGKYYCSNLTLNMGCLKDKMNPNFEGSYIVLMKIKDGNRNDISCHTMGAVVKEKDKRK